MKNRANIRYKMDFTCDKFTLSMLSMPSPSSNSLSIECICPDSARVWSGFHFAWTRKLREHSNQENKHLIGPKTVLYASCTANELAMLIFNKC